MVTVEEKSTSTVVNPLWERFASLSSQTQSICPIQPEKSLAISTATLSTSNTTASCTPSGSAANTMPSLAATSDVPGDDDYTADGNDDDNLDDNCHTADEYDGDYDGYEEDDGNTEGNDTRTTNTYSRGGDTGTISSMADESITAENASRFQKVTNQHRFSQTKNISTLASNSGSNCTPNIATKAVVTKGTSDIYSGSSNSCYVAESLCGFGYDATKSRQLNPTLLPTTNATVDVINTGNSSNSTSQQQRNNLKKEIRELRQRNYQLYHQNRLLLEEKQIGTSTTAGADSNNTTGASRSSNVSELQQRCLEAEFKNVQYEKQITEVLNTQSQINRTTNSSISDPTMIYKRQEEEIKQLRQELQFLKEQIQNNVGSTKDTVKSTDSNETNQALTERDATIAALCEQITAYQKQQQDIQQYKDQIVVLETHNKQLDLETQEAAIHLDHTKEYCHDVVTEIEAKYSTMEHRLLQTKLELAAVNESKEQMAEEYQNSLSTMQEKIEQLKNQVIVKEREKEDLAAKLADDKKIATELDQHRRTMTSLHAEVASLQNERSTLQEMISRMQLKEETTEVTDKQLRSKLNLAERTIEELRSQIAGSVVKELDQSRNNDTAREVETLTKNVDDLNAKVKLLKKRLYVTKNENSRFRAQLISKSKNDGDMVMFCSNDWKLNESSDETAETVDVDDDETSDNSALTSRRLLKERDDAISSLVRQAIEQDQVIKHLNGTIETLKTQQKNKEMNIRIHTNDADETAMDTTMLVQQLQEEAEVYASQVIELNGDILELKTIITQCESKILTLENEINDSKASVAMNRLVDTVGATETEKGLQAKVTALEAEIDELKEANLTQRDELRDLRRKLLQTESRSDEIVNAQNEATRLKVTVATQQTKIDQLNQAIEALSEELRMERVSKSAQEIKYQQELSYLQKSDGEKVALLEKKLDETRWEYDELKSSPGHMSEEAVKAIRDELDDLRQRHSCQTEELLMARSTVQELEEILAEKSAQDAAGFEEEKEELFSEIEALTKSLNDANEKILTLEADTGIIADFKDKLERADEAREASEKNIIDTFERRISLLTLDKDVVIDKLRKELAIEKESTAEEMESLTSQLKEYQLEISEIREEMSEQIGHRDARIYALEATVTAQEQLVSNMKAEMDHLQSSMENSVARRKDENDEMQQELLMRTAAVAKYEREITSLKVELEGKDLEYRAIISKLEQKIMTLETAPTELRNAQDLQMELRVKEVKDRLEKLKWRNTALKDENVNLRERLEQAELLARTGGCSDRMKELEAELANQILKVNSLESELSRRVMSAPTDDDETSVTIGSSSRTSPIMEMSEKNSSKDSSSAVQEPLPIDSTQAVTVVDSSSVRPPRAQKMSLPSPPRRTLKIFGRK